jgi:hypothetical protein
MQLAANHLRFCCKRRTYTVGWQIGKLVFADAVINLDVECLCLSVLGHN